MHLQGKPVCSFDPEGLIFAAGVNSEMVKLYDLRSFDKVWVSLYPCLCMVCVLMGPVRLKRVVDNRV